MVVEQKQCIIDPMLIKSKCFKEAVVFLKELHIKQLNIEHIFWKDWKKPHCLSNTFWLYQYRVNYAPFQCYSHLLLMIFNWNTLYNSGTTKLAEFGNNFVNFEMIKNRILFCIKFKIIGLGFVLCHKILKVSRILHVS